MDRLSDWAEGCPVTFEGWERERIPQFKANALDRLVAAGNIKESDRCAANDICGEVESLGTFNASRSFFLERPFCGGNRDACDILHFSRGAIDSCDAIA